MAKGVTDANPDKRWRIYMSDELALADVIEALRQELATAIERGKDQDIGFKLGDIDVELATVVKSGGENRAGIDFKVIQAGTKETLSRESVHTIRLSLKPVDTSRSSDDPNADPEVRVGDITDNP